MTRFTSVPQRLSFNNKPVTAQQASIIDTVHAIHPDHASHSVWSVLVKYDVRNVIICGCGDRLEVTDQQVQARGKAP